MKRDRAKEWLPERGPDAARLPAAEQPAENPPRDGASRLRPHLPREVLGEGLADTIRAGGSFQHAARAAYPCACVSAGRVVFAGIAHSGHPPPRP